MQSDEMPTKEQSSDTSRPTIFEVVQIAAMLGSSAGQNKSAFELIEQAMDLWQAAQDFRKAESEERVLLATVAKMWDDQKLFKNADHANSRRKGPPQITYGLWLDRLVKYPGDRIKLLYKFVYADGVPVGEFLKELFPQPRVSRRKQMNELLTYAGKEWASRFLYEIVHFLTGLSPLKEDWQPLLTALRTDDIRKAMEWMSKIETKDSIKQRRLQILILDAMDDCSECFSGVNVPLPGLLCRKLIHFRQMQISGLRAEAARKKDQSSFPKNPPAEQPVKRRKR